MYCLIVNGCSSSASWVRTAYGNGKRCGNAKHANHVGTIGCAMNADVQSHRNGQYKNTGANADIVAHVAVGWLDLKIR